jgi:hypothetical protein
VTITIHAPTPEALEAIASRMCAEDVAELTAIGWASPLDAVLQSCDASREAYIAYWDGQPQAAFGVADFSLDTTLGVPWMLSTGPRGKVAREFIRVSRKYIAEVSPLYTALFNFVDARHLRAQRWLLSLGFMPYKVHECNGFPFIEFGRFHNV